MEKPQLILEGIAVQSVECYKYLGVQIDAQLRWKEQAQRAIASATKWLLQYRRLTRPSTGAGPKLMRQLYLTVALPKITYGIDIWYSPPLKPIGYTKNTGSVGVLRNLQKTQRLATTAITGTFRTAPTDLIDVHAGVFPIELALLKACHRAIIRSHTLPPTHPLHKIIRQAKRNPPTKHLSPIDRLIKNFNMIDLNMEIITPSTKNPLTQPSYGIHIDSNREASITSERNDTADFRIFSDGSGQEDGIGAAAILFKKHSARPIKTLKYHMGPPTSHNTYEAETVGAILAIWIIKNTVEAIGKTVSLYIDNQALVKALKSTGSKTMAGQYLIDNFKKAAR